MTWQDALAVLVLVLFVLGALILAWGGGPLLLPGIG